MAPNKSLIYIGILVGGVIGGYVPVLFGVSYWSGVTIFSSMVGSLLGIWAAYKLST